MGVTPDAGDPCLTVDISAHTTELSVPGAARWLLPVGSTSLWAPTAAGPSAIAVEAGIQRVEDEIERVVDQLPRGATLRLSAATGALLRRGGGLAGWSPGSAGLADVEREYQWLAARAVGARSAHGTAFDDPAADAVVLILRELMHHLAASGVRGPD